MSPLSKQIWETLWLSWQSLNEELQVIKLLSLTVPIVSHFARLRAKAPVFSEPNE
jgi:hypothetical protein